MTFFYMYWNTPCLISILDFRRKNAQKGRSFTLLHFVLLLLVFGCARQNSAQNGSYPNILIILADDLGYGDVGCYNPESNIPTPNLDRMAGQGMMFTDGHSPSTVCTPTRYSIMTGRMAFRTGMESVFTGTGGPCLIEEGRLTLPAMLKEKGYATAMFGKWHIGLTFLDSIGQPVEADGVEGVRRVDFSRSMPDAPIHRGFDQFFDTASCPTTDWLYAFIEGDRIPVPPVGVIDRSLLPNHPYSLACRPGLIAPGFDLEEVDMLFLEKSREFLEHHVSTKPDQPFFLFHSAQAVHLPSFPGDGFKGKTSAGPHGDFIFELDYIVGALLETLEKLGVADNTLVFFCSDNGPEVPTTIRMRKDYGHDSARPWRGMKRDQWEGGHRTPLLIRWPGKIEANSKSDQLVSLTDIMATCAALVDFQLPVEAAEDSYNILPVLLGIQGEDPVREYMLQQTLTLALSIRNGRWKYLDHQGSGGNNYEFASGFFEGLDQYYIEDTDPKAPGQLYDLEIDPGERHNLYSQHPEVADRLKQQLDTWVENGRSTPAR